MNECRNCFEIPTSGKHLISTIRVTTESYGGNKETRDRYPGLIIHQLLRQGAILQTFPLLGCDAVLIGTQLLTFRDNPSVLPSRVNSPRSFILRLYKEESSLCARHALSRKSYQTME